MGPSRVYLLLPIILVLNGAACFGQAPKKPPVKSSQPTKRGLIVAISDYDSRLGWRDLSSHYDLRLIRGALEQIGFLRKDIDSLVDSEATREGILRALNSLASKSKRGDMVFIHVSSHGQQITDNVNPDEQDGYDETIVAFGAPAGEDFYRQANRARGVSVPPYDGNYHLRDDDLGKAIDAIRAKVGKDGHVLVTLDACHSGTGTRGSGVARGTEPPFDLQGVPPKEKTGGQETEYGLDISRNHDLGKFVLISGAASKEINYEAKDDNVPARQVGSLSFAISKALPSMPANSTYRMLFARITAIMAEKAPNQSPQLEGDAADAKLFDDGYIPQAPYLTVARIISRSEVRLKAGRMARIVPGTTVSIKSNLDRKELAQGEVVEADNLGATVKLDRDLAEKRAVNLQVHVLSYSFEANTVVVSLDSVRNSGLKAALTDSLTSKGLAIISAKSPELIVSDRGSRAGRISASVRTTAYDTPLMMKPVTGTEVQGVVRSVYDLIENYVQGKNFRAMDMEDGRFSVEVRLIPVRKDQYGPADCLADTISSSGFRDAGGTMLIPEGAPFIVAFSNTGTSKAYFNLIDLEANGKVSPVFPKLDESGSPETPPEEFVLEPGKSRAFCHVLTFSPPYGMELLKVFASGVPFNLSAVINTKGAEVGTRGASPTPLEKLIGKVIEPPSTRGPTMKAPRDEMGVNTYEFPFKIVPRKTN